MISFIIITNAWSSTKINQDSEMKKKLSGFWKNLIRILRWKNCAKSLRQTLPQLPLVCVCSASASGFLPKNLQITIKLVIVACWYALTWYYIFGLFITIDHVHLNLNHPESWVEEWIIFFLKEEERRPETAYQRERLGEAFTRLTQDLGNVVISLLW